MNFKQQYKFKKQQNEKFGYITKTDGNGNQNNNHRNNNQRQQVPSLYYGRRQANVASALREFCDSLEAQDTLSSNQTTSANVNASEALPSLRQILCSGV